MCVYKDITTGLSNITESLCPSQASDFDISAPNNEIIYSIEPGTGSDKFSIDETTGDIFFNDFVDYETDVKFELTVVAADKGEPSLNATALVTVDITVSLQIQNAGKTFYHFSRWWKVAEIILAKRKTCHFLFGNLFVS